MNLIKELSEDLTQKIINWNNIDQKIFEKANSTFWSRYNKIPNLELLKNEFQIETGNIVDIILIINILHFTIYFYLEKVKRFCLLDAGRDRKPNDPKCSRAVGVKLKGVARKKSTNNF